MADRNFLLEELDPDPGFFSIPPVRSSVREYIQICILLWKIHMNEYLIANTNFRIWILNCRGREINRKNNTRCNNIKRRTSTECRYMKWTIDITSKKPIYKSLNSKKKLKLYSATRFSFKDFIPEWRFEETKKLQRMIFFKTTSFISLNTFLCLFLTVGLKPCKISFWIALSIFQVTNSSL